MKSYTYKVTLEMLTGAKGEPVEREPLVFEAFNHDDLMMLTERMQSRLPYPPNEAAQMLVGLKLLGEMTLAHREDALFAELRPAIAEFIGKLKGA